MSLQVFDLSAENAPVRESALSRLAALFDNSEFASGYRDGPVEELERTLARWCGRRYALGMGSGTLALEAAAIALDLGPGDEVVVPANTFLATAAAVAARGAKVVAADVDDQTWNLSAQTVARAVGPRTRAVFAVNLYGNPCPWDELEALGLPVVEDAAHSPGAQYAGRNGVRQSGGLGRLSAFSFFPSKTLGAIGDAGMVLFDDPAAVEPLRAWRNCGQGEKHRAVMLGTVARMDVLQAAFLLEKWRVFEAGLAHRRQLAAVYDECFRDSPVRTQRTLPGSLSGHWVYVVRVPDRAAVTTALQAADIGWSIQYPYLLQQQPFWEGVAARPLETPVADVFVQEILTLPLHRGLSEADVRRVAEVVLSAVREPS